MNYKRVIVCVLALAFFLQGIFSLREKSATHDETAHIAAGYSYWKTGDFRLNKEHPPLIKLLAGLPLLFLKPDFPFAHPSWQNGREWEFASQFIYNNRVPPERIIFWARIPMLLLGVLLGFFVYKWSSKLYGTGAGLFALFLYCFAPNILAHSRLVTTDLGITLFIFLTVYTFWRWLKNPAIKNLIWTGVCFGLALATKFTAVILVPVGLLLSLVWYFGSSPKQISFRRLLLALIIIGCLGGIILLASYGFFSFDKYIIGFKRVQIELQKGHEAFLFGRYSSRGWWYYFIPAFLIKTPIPMLCFLVLSIYFVIANPSHVIASVSEAISLGTGSVKPRQVGASSVRFLAMTQREANHQYFLLIPVIFLLISAAFSHKQIGLRYILSIYPFLFVWVSRIARSKVRGPKSKVRHQTSDIRHWTLDIGHWTKLGFLILVLWYFIGTVRVYPDYLAYFNEFVGGPKNGWKCLADSNLDWGQDLKRLGHYLKREGNPELILSYFGTASPEYYGIQYQNLLSTKMFPREFSHINSLHPQKELLAISATNLQAVYHPNRVIFDWLKSKPPQKQIGYSIFVWDITNDGDAHLQLSVIYAREKKLKKTERELKRAEIINPEYKLKLAAEACNILGGEYFREGKLSEAKKWYKRALFHNPKDAVALNNLGVVYEHQGRDTLAEQKYQQAIDSDHYYAEAYYNLGVIYWKQKKWEKVIEQFERVLSIDPNYQRAKKYLQVARQK